jgi:glycosyltransferase involved in cell wall biosynthesis
MSSIIKFCKPNLIWICTLHDAYIKGVYSGYWVFFFFKNIWKNANKVIVVSSYVEKWANDYLQILPQKIVLINHGMIFNNKEKKINKRKSKIYQLGCLARYENRKGFLKLVEIMSITVKTFPNIELHLAGSNPFGFKKDVRALINKYNLSDKVILHDFKLDTDKFLENLDLYLYASEAEGFGLTIIEALSFNLPVICFDIAPLNNIIKKGNNGILVKPYDLEHFSNCIIKILSNKKLYEKLTKENATDIKKKFSIEKMLVDVNKVYDETIHNNKL